MPTDPIHELQILASEVGDTLSAYVTVHEKIFNEAASLKSVLKNLLGRGVPMSELLADAESLVPLVKAVRGRVAVFRAQSSLALPEAPRAYAALLLDYVGALDHTIAALVTRQRLAHESSRGARSGSATWSEFKTAEASYEQAIESYRAIGARLNEASDAAFPS